jgi:hypothetical protein
MELRQSNRFFHFVKPGRHLRRQALGIWHVHCGSSETQPEVPSTLPGQAQAIVLAVASGERQAQVSDWGVDGGYLMAYNHVVLPPHSSYELVAYLALAESVEEAQRYGSLAGVE